MTDHKDGLGERFTPPVLAFIICVSYTSPQPAQSMRSILPCVAALFLTACDGGAPTPPAPPAFANPPEVAAREITLGAQVNETLANPTDVDEFTFTASAAGVVAVMVHAQEPGEHIEISVIDSVTREVAATASATGYPRSDGALWADVVPGRWIVQMKGAGASPGAYSFAVHSVNPHPEDGDSVPESGTWQQGEISPSHDADDFVFDGVAGEQVNLFGDTRDSREARLLVRLRAPGAPGGEWMWEKVIDDGTRLSTGVFTLPTTGRYRLRVTTAQPTGAPGQPYQVLVYRIVPAPEEVPAVLVRGLVVREGLGMPGDVDEYTFTAREGELLRLEFVVENLSSPGVTVVLRDAQTGEHVPVNFHRFLAPRTGTYRLTVARPGWFYPEAQPHWYRVGLLPLDPAPEGVSATIVVGDTVSEALAPHGDIDEYTFAGTAGTEVVVLAEAPAYASVDLHRVDTDERLARVRSWRTSGGLGRHASQRLRLPVSGQYRVRVWHDEDAYRSYAPAGEATDDGLSPAYRFSVAPISRLPEGRPAAIAIGDTVVEAIDPKHDIDIYTFTAQAGDRLVLWGHRWNYALPFEPLVLFVTEQNSPSALAWVIANQGVPEGDTFTVPATGTYRVVVLPANAVGLQGTTEEGEYEGGYRFTLSRAP